MGVEAWGAVVLALFLSSTALALVRWRARLGPFGDVVVDQNDVAVDTATREGDLAFDRIVGYLLVTDPTFADSAARLAERDDFGPGT